MTARDAPHRFQLLLLLALVLFCARLHAQAPRVSVSIPEGPAQRTFQMFFAQTRIEILYLADVVKDVRTHPVTGELDADEAIRQMIEDTGLEFQFFQNYSFVSLRPKTDARQAAKAAESVVPVSLPEKNLRQPAPALVVPLVTITGTYIPGAGSSTSPLRWSSPRAERRSPAATERFRTHSRNLPMASKAGPGEDFSGNGNFNRGSSINLRGLGSGATLVLVNGRRQSPSGSTRRFRRCIGAAGYGNRSHRSPCRMVPRLCTARTLSQGSSTSFFARTSRVSSLSCRRGTAIGGGDEDPGCRSSSAQTGTTERCGADINISHRSALSAAERRYSAKLRQNVVGWLQTSARS